MTQDLHPLITIGMTCYNGEDTIGQALDAALRQDWPNTEIVIVDDGSSDGSVALIESLIAGRAHARLIRHPQNKGFASALNTLIENARGDFIAIFDDDDEAMPERLRRQYERLTAYERESGAALVACYASMRRQYANEHVKIIDAIGSRPKIPQGADMIAYHLYGDRDPSVFYGGGTPSCSLMARRSTFLAAGPYDPTLRRHEDSDFAVRLALKGGHFVGCAEYVIRQGSTGGADKRPQIAYESARNFLRKYKEILEKNGRYDFALGWASVHYYHYSHRHLKLALTLLRLALRHPLLTLPRALRVGPRRLKHEARIKRAA